MRKYENNGTVCQENAVNEHFHTGHTHWYAADVRQAFSVECDYDNAQLKYCA